MPNGVLIDVKSIYNKKIFLNSNTRYGVSKIFMQKYIVTGSAGFIGMHLCNSLLKEGYEVCGIDNLNSCYSISLKDRINELVKYPKFIFHKVDVIDNKKSRRFFLNLNLQW